MIPLSRPRLRWAGRKRKWRPLVLVAWVGLGLAGLVLGFALLSWALGGDDGFFRVDRACENNAFACNTGVELLGTGSAIALAFVYFTSWRLKRVTRAHLAEARTQPWHLVPTATKIDEVVGRTGLCEIIETDLADKSRYRPQVIVAGVGDGKTAVLVRLTQWLYERGAVPVAIRLRDAVDELDFIELAKDQFTDSVGPRLLSADEGDKVWRELCTERLVVILADGLEEALPNATSAGARTRAVRLAISKARKAGTPLVIATRPDPVLEQIDVATIRLEPLPAHRVIEYIGNVRDEDTSAPIEQLAQTAEVMERPLYLTLARDLHRRGKLREIPLDKGRVAARFELLESWRRGLIDDPQGDERHVGAEDREQALSAAQEMACVAMETNSLEIALKQFADSPYTQTVSAHDTKVLADLAERLDVVDLIRDHIRFRHSIMQAYLGARHLPQLFDGNGPPAASAASTTGNDEVTEYLEAALRDPGRELMMALVLSCLVNGGEAHAESLRDRLCDAAENSGSHARFELLAAAYEIDAQAKYKRSDRLRETAGRVWHRQRSPGRDVQTTEAKLRAILPIAEAGQRCDGDAYRVLWDICRAEDTYAVRFQAAQALAGGGKAALEVVAEEVEEAAESADKLLAYRDGQPPAAQWEDIRGYSVLGWVMPLLAATCDESDAEPVHQAIEAWTELARAGAPGHPRLHLGVEAALAQGFKWEANRLPNGEYAPARERLIECALDQLSGSAWWYTQISLLQALTLWALDSDGPLTAKTRQRIATYSSRHPLLSQVASLCNDAIQRSGRTVRELGRRRAPSRYVWIDEVGVAAKIGPKELPADSTTDLWIPPAAGWHALTPVAQQLVADILVFLNLVEGGERLPGGGAALSANSELVREREARRARVHVYGADLPVCLSRAQERDRLGVGVPSAEDGEVERRGPPCPNQSCDFRLCPYPTKAEGPFRGELNETFCREQERLLRGRDRRLPPWEETASFLAFVPRRGVFNDLRRFWTDMEERNQGLGPRARRW